MPAIINADNGVISGSVGLKYASDNSGVLALQTNGNTAVTIDTSGNMGVGTTAAFGGKINIEGGNSGNTAAIIIGNGNGNARAAINYDVGNVRLGFGVGATPTTSGLSLYAASNGGHLQFNTSGAGIIFNNANALINSTLNDYETGTFTPVFQPSGYTFTQTIAQGWYTKIGNQVFCKIYMSVTRTAGSGGSQGIISGLPFTLANNNGSYGGGSIFPDTGASFFTGPLYIRGLPNTTNINLGTGFNGNPLGYIFTWSNMTTLELEVTFNYQATF